MNFESLRFRQSILIYEKKNAHFEYKNRINLSSGVESEISFVRIKIQEKILWRENEVSNLFSTNVTVKFSFSSLS